LSQRLPPLSIFISVSSPVPFPFMSRFLLHYLFFILDEELIGVQLVWRGGGMIC
jgi:hypothetical protein